MMTYADLLAFFVERNGVTAPPDTSWFVKIEAAEKAAGRPFAPDHKALMQAVGGLDLGSMEFAHPSPDITVSYYPKLVKLGEEMGMAPDAMPIILDNGELILGYPDGHIEILSFVGLTGEKWPDLASFLSQFLEAE